MRHPKNEGDARRLLRRLGCRRRRWARVRARWFIVLVVTAGGWIALSLSSLGKIGDLKLELATGIAIGTSLFAIVQWRTTAEEKAVDAYKERISALNAQQAESWAAVNALMYSSFGSSPAAKTSFKQTLYTYAALDGLEFALERYEGGGVSGYTACQELLTFRAKCRSEQFLERALFCINAGSYSPSLGRALSHVRRDVARERSSRWPESIPESPVPNGADAARAT